MTGLSEVLSLYAERGLRPWLEDAIAPHLSRWEVVCRCGICFRCTLSPELRQRWTSLREAAGTPLVVASGLRCPAQQIRVNPGVPKSMHLHGEALDVAWPVTFDRTRFHRLAEEIVGDGGLGCLRLGDSYRHRQGMPSQKAVGGILLSPRRPVFGTGNTFRFRISVPLKTIRQWMRKVWVCVAGIGRDVR